MVRGIARLHLVRHGRAAAGWDHALDPGLDAVGHGQARALIAALASVGPQPIVVSPMRRTRETAAPLEVEWGTTARVEPRIAEIPSPLGVAMEHRSAWLRHAMAGSWSDLDDSYRVWRDTLITTLAALEAATVVVSHFIAINVAIGRAVGDDRMVVHALDNCSITVIDVDGSSFRLVESGSEAPETLVL